MKLTSIHAALLMFGIGIIGFLFISRQSSSSKFTIGILQTASHPALDAAREGFMETVDRALPNEVTFLVRNAQGSIANAHTIAQSFHAHDSIDAVFTIATPAAQAMASVEKHKPVFFAAVSNPQAAGIIQSNITGSVDMIDVIKLVESLKDLVPQAQTIGIVFTTAEANSRHQVSLMKRAVINAGLTPLEFGISSEAEVPAAIIAACQKSDALLLPNDNVLSSSIQLIAATALKHKTPVIASDILLVDHGILAALGINYRASGAQTAQLALEVLTQGKKPHELPITKPLTHELRINKDTLQALK